ncbi:MAG TPA: ATP-binding cassette domain-containing protein [Bacilli bacterium]|nr:ATP-binding cassette domain-containing protein [Bacilli bacterium]
MLQLRNVFKNYYVDNKPLKVLKDINLTFPKQQFVTIVGPSGCGKTTLLNLIGGLDQYTSGDLIIEGKSTKQFKDKDWDAYRNHRVGFVFQSYNLITHLTVLDNVAMSLTLTGMSSKERIAKAKEALLSVGLESEMYKQTNQLSGGQMQRVAIARALVNDPSIILADEPTGALDSKTSEQVMDIIKEVSKTRLVIMVSHNEVLAKKYSDRIIRMLDGVIENDTAKEVSISSETTGKEINKYTSMPFSMALKSSFKNIMTKKGRSIITSVAGSLGIIGVALVASLSTGFNSYIAKVESDTMASYPIGVFSNSFELSPTAFKEVNLKDFPTEEEVYVYDPNDSAESSFKYYFNQLTPDFLNFVEGLEDSGLASSVILNYPTHMKLLTEYPNGSINYAGSTNFSQLTPTASGTFTQLFGDREYVSEYYDLIGTTSRYPENANEIVLVIDRYNRVKVGDLQRLGFLGSGAAEIDKFSFDEIIGKTYKLLDNDDFYVRDNAHDFVVGDLSTASGTKTIEKYGIDYNNIVANYNDDNKGIKLEIVGVLRPRAGTEFQILSQGLAFTNELNAMMQNFNRDSEFSKSIFHNITIHPDALTDMENALDYVRYYDPTYDSGNPQKLLSQTDMLNLAKRNNSQVSDIDHSTPLGLAIMTTFQRIYSNVESIAIFPSSAQARKDIKTEFDQYNKAQAADFKIIYSDLVSTITDSLATMVNIVSIVLIFFTSISLVVSGVLIGIITYISVIERTKEIGVLRAIGARKKDVGRLFQAETFIIGLFAGLIGVISAYILTIPINLILNNMFPDQNIGTIANLTPWIALLLITINVALTMISGLLPSSIAARKNPVEALRTE